MMSTLKGVVCLPKSAYLAVFALPNKVGLSPAPAHLVHFLQ